MPESRKRKKVSPATSSGETQSSATSATKLAPSPRWWAPVMVALLLLGLLWVVVTYLFQAAWPIPGIGRWNLAVGFGLMIAGMIMSMGWR